MSVQEILPLVEAALPEYDLPGHHHKRRRPAPKQVATAQPRPIETVSGAIQDLARELSRTN